MLLLTPDTAALSHSILMVNCACEVCPAVNWLTEMVGRITSGVTLRATQVAV